MHDAAPYLALVVSYRGLAPVAAPASAPAGPRQRDESWRDTLSKADWPLFNTPGRTGHAPRPERFPRPRRLALTPGD